jgi:hypothetical protein
MIRHWRRAARASVVLAAVITATAACGDDSTGGATTSGTTDSGARATFDTPADGDRVAGGVALTMRAEGVTIEAAGEARDGAGHFHVIADDGCTDPGVAIGRDADHVHFGKGQREGVIYLEPGPHELCLQVGDGTHIATDVTDTVSIEVGIEDRDEWCTVVREVDEMFEAVDGSTEEFASKQAGYANVNRLLAQLAAADRFVDEAARDDVMAVVGFSADLTEALVSAKDEASATAATEALFADEAVRATNEAGAADWIEATCDVRIDA